MAAKSLTAERQPAHDSLISYHRADESLVRPILEQLRALGISYWIDNEQVRAGDDWRDKIPPAMEGVASVVIFFGPGGPGRWQMEEWKYLSKECVEKGKRFIPVLLAGGAIPDDLQLTTRLAVEFRGDPAADAEAFAQLVVAIDDQKQLVNEYHLVVRVNSEGPSCCLALPFGADARLVEALQTAAELAGLTVIQTTDGSQIESYRADVVAAVRGSSLLLADCTIGPTMNHPDPNVTFQIGVAKSLNKPVLMLSNAPLSVVDLFKIEVDEIAGYDRDAWSNEDPNTSGRLVDELQPKLRALLNQLSPPYLAKRGHADVAVVRADLWTMQSAFWESFHKLQSAGLRIHHAFRHVAPSVHSLERMTELLQEDLTSIDNDVHHQHDCCQVHRAHREFVSKHNEQVLPALVSFASEQAGNEHALGSLAARAANSTAELVERARRYYKLLSSMVEIYRSASEPLTHESWLPINPSIERIVHPLMQIHALRKVVDHVELHAYEMLTCLLELIGHSPSTGGSPDGR